jgi:Uncharacterized protein conserved in bacteria
MKKAKIVSFLLSMILLLPICSLFAEASGSGGYAIGDVLGAAVYSNISTYINFNQIESLNFNGNTEIIVEDLTEYGFDVKWDETNHALYINGYHSEQYVINQYVASVVPDSEVGTEACDVIYSDIKTYINGTLTECYNVNGYTMIPIDSLKQYGELTWNPNQKSITLITSSHKPVDKLYYNPRTLQYYGEVKDHKAHGYGSYYSANGSLLYQGGFYEGHFSGYGTLYFPDGGYYKGDFVNDEMTGVGQIYNKNDVIYYLGNVINGIANGYGIAYNENGDIIYKGDFKNDTYDGYGTLYDDDGEIAYKGYFSNGEITGRLF